MVLGATDSGWTNSETWYVVRLPKLSRVNEIIKPVLFDQVNINWNVQQGNWMAEEECHSVTF